MIFRVFPGRDLALLFDIMAVNPIVGPVAMARNLDGKTLYDFAMVTDFAELCLDFDQTIHSPKNYFLPYREQTCAFSVQGQTWQEENTPSGSALVLFGLHACDINALNKLDKVLLAAPYPDLSYQARRRQMFIIGHACQPTPACFCRSMGADFVRHGCDLFLTPMGDDYFVEIMTSRAFHILENLHIRQPRPQELRKFEDLANERQSLFTTRVETSDLTKILDLEFDSSVWKVWGERCLSCGTCAQVCPTCYCYGIEEKVDMDLRGAAKVRQLYSCNLLDFAQVAGGHNFRPESRTRLKYRYYHKHRGFVEAFEEALCVGCGRCGTNCLADITVPAVIASVRQGEVEDERTG